MRRSTIGWVALGIVAVFGLGFAYFWFSGGSGEPSTELTTPPIAEQTTTSATGPETTAAPGSSTTTANSSDAPFVIQADQSEASFTLNEVLRGSPKTVVGSTQEVAGQFILVTDSPASSEFSPIVVNARTFTTDSSTRDRAIRGPIILNSASDEFEFITFEVTGISGLDEPVAVGDSITFTLTGDLTVKGVTNEADFEVTATYVDEQTITGTATTEVLRSDFDIGIPNVASVADVTDEVTIQLDFVATRS